MELTLRELDQAYQSLIQELERPNLPSDIKYAIRVELDQVVYAYNVKEQNIISQVEHIDDQLESTRLSKQARLVDQKYDEAAELRDHERKLVQQKRDWLENG